MEWLTLPALWGVPAGLIEVWTGYNDIHGVAADQRFGEAAPTELDLSLIEALYEAIAATTFCIRCGAPLGRRLRLVSSSLPPEAPGSWHLLVLTCCHGWLRHAYAAEVTEQARDLRIGRFSRV